MGVSPDQRDSEAQDRRFTILVVEDEPLVRLVTADNLRDSGYKVVEAGTAVEALSAVASDEKIDLVFTDVLMPGSIGGLTLASWLLSNHPAIPVILTSGIGAVRRYMKGRETLPFLEKPYQADELLRLISSTLSEAGRKDT